MRPRVSSLSKKKKTTQNQRTHRKKKKKKEINEGDRSRDLYYSRKPQRKQSASALINGVSVDLDSKKMRRSPGVIFFLVATTGTPRERKLTSGTQVKRVMKDEARGRKPRDTSHGGTHVTPSARQRGNRTQALFQRKRSAKN